MPKKRGLEQFVDLRGRLDKKEGGGIFEEGQGVDKLDTPIHTMVTVK